MKKKFGTRHCRRKLQREDDVSPGVAGGERLEVEDQQVTCGNPVLTRATKGLLSNMSWTGMEYDG